MAWLAGVNVGQLVEVEDAGDATFDYKLSEAIGDEFIFTVDGDYRFGRNGSIGWNTAGTCSVTGSGTHTLRWQFSKDSSGSVSVSSQDWD